MFLPDINFWLALTFEVHAHKPRGFRHRRQIKAVRWSSIKSHSLKAWIILSRLCWNSRSKSSLCNVARGDQQQLVGFVPQEERVNEILILRYDNIMLP